MDDIKEKETIEDKKTIDTSTIDEIIRVLDTVRPFIQRDGGDIKFVKYEDGIVYVRVYGACVGCMAIESTLKDGVEAILKEEVPEVVEVINVEEIENKENLIDEEEIEETEYF